ncbi:trehalose operon repressor [Paenibacillus tuaregi]|uniref:trehalose operon repressor n=1 Tax=Paenibacillus tuaregi TaxID=1816681 RepID=UPI000838238C|nr:trehalose operon repressor [Paenibacillus tuaregi]
MNKNIYLNIYNDYAQQIQRGLLSAGTKLPSESELAEKYTTTRETVRKALNLLSQNGYIHKMMGKGSFVLDIGRMDFPITGLISFKEMSERIGRPSRTIVDKTSIIQAPEEIAGFLQIRVNEPVWEVIRVREIEGEKVILDKDYFLLEAVQSLTKEIASGSIYDYLEHTLNLVISYAKKKISVEEATEEDIRLLDLKGMSHVVVVRNFVYLEDTTLFQYTESRHRLDKFQFVDFARRIH